MSSFGSSPRSGASPSRTDVTAHVAESPQSADRPFGGAYSMPIRWEGDVVRLARKSSVPKGDAVGQQPVSWGGKPSWWWESKQVSGGCGQTAPWPSGSLFEPGQRRGAIGFRRLPSSGKRSNCFIKHIFSRGVPRSQGPQRDFFQKEGKTGSRSSGLGTRGLARRPSLPAGHNRDREKALLQPTRCPPLEGLPQGLSPQGIEDKATRKN